LVFRTIHASIPSAWFGAKKENFFLWRNPQAFSRALFFFRFWKDKKRKYIGVMVIEPVGKWEKDESAGVDRLFTTLPLFFRGLKSCGEKSVECG
jgi:hypothetical protein